MKLIYKILLRASVAMLAIMLCWAVLFYYGMMKEINDEIDDMLSDYSEQLIVNFLSGGKLIPSELGASGEYQLEEITQAQAESMPQISYEDGETYIYRIDDIVPSRIMTTVFGDNEGRYYRLTVATPSYEKEDISESLLLWTSILYICLTIATIAIFATVFYRSMRPFYILINWLDNYKIGQQNAPLENPTDIKEFARLNDVATRAMKRNEQLYEQQRQFTGNASHELQTPLAICMNRLEMLMEDENLSPEQMEAMAKVLDSLENIQKLNKSMLLLSKIENGQFPATTKDVSFRGIVDKVIDDYTAIYQHKGMTVDYKPTADFRCDINEQLATTLVTNLLKNAFVHGEPGGIIRIDTCKTSFSVATGIATEPLDGEAVFQRFNQGKHKKKESSGLGLAIVKSICEQFNLKANYYFSEGFHVFTIEKTAI